MHGALLVDKPCGPTSHDIVAFVRRTLKTTRVGHTGTLDPLATGLLVLLVGHATRLSQFLVTDEKEYVADVRLGVSSPTYDAQGLDATRPPQEPGSFRLRAEGLDRVLADFVGTFPQLPPQFSAKKVDGERAYRKARRQEPVALKPVEVTLHELETISLEDSLLRLRIVCSSGFYVRSLAHDVGQVLGCGAHLEALRRSRAGRFRVEDAATLEALDARGAASADRLLSSRALLADMPAVSVTEEGLRRAGHGNSLAPHHLAAPAPPAAGGPICVLDASGGVLAIADARSDGLLHPLVVLR